MKVEIIQTESITAYVGVRTSGHMIELGKSVTGAFDELVSRRHEIRHLKNANVTYGITPPNYKGNPGPVDFYCCYEVNPLANVPHGMVHIHLLPRLYSVTSYRGPASKTASAYDFTSRWLLENGYAYDDAAYYFERYDDRTRRETDDDRNEVTIYCPVKRQGE
ncbi:GyrI-like domain-containing protein [Paenibacillus harenae]|uniref:GyrI-like domain-containing protein n=1 Tax=Paenibacillus harenae TaxID=306543 RepID=UPI000429DA5A|nr:GyrI-like domain-containing protein [Paenibacillus harenae]